MTTKTLKLNFRNHQELLEFLEQLAPLTSKYKSIRRMASKNRRLEIQIDTMLDDAHAAINAIKNLYSITRPKPEAKSIPLPLLLANLQASANLPLNLLEELAEIRGQKLELKGQTIKTSIDLKTLQNMVKNLAEIYSEAVTLPLTPHARRIITLYAYLNHETPRQALNDLASKKLLKQNKQKRWALTKPYQQALQSLKKINKNMPNN